MSGQPPAVQETSDGQADTSKTGTEQFSVPVRIIEDPIEAKRARDRDEKTDKHDADDLQAQRDAADGAQRGANAAEWQVIPAWAQIIFALVGTVALIYTLLLTRSALILSRTTAESEQRAYLSGGPDGDKETPPFHYWNRIISVQCQIFNHGLTPAQDMVARGHIDVCPYPLPDDHAFPNCPSGPSRGVVFPGKGHHYQFKRTISEEQREAILAGTRFIYIFGEIEYVDMFKQKHMTRFCFLVRTGENVKRWLRGENFSGGCFFEAANLHNEIN